jgi:sigma-E factor negative regulatory protein RseC
MIEETGRVVKVQGDYAWIETGPAATCGSCSARKGCGTSVLASVFGRRRSPVRALNRAGARTGEQVVIGISESSLVRGSLAVYMVPLAGLLVGALAGRYFGMDLLPAYAELASIVGAVAGLLAGLAWLRFFSRASDRDERYQPVVMRHQIATSR